ncbi:EG45-like domain containing protein [Tasmannia lanceolata]|uniref:EG45-like domain containing protein n=1 Tax=Tasmannia lanceolata TaxID=3420 RepID=UPI0040630C4F
MSKPQHILSCLSFFFLLFHLCKADVGTAASYEPPYLPTACYGDDASQIPANNLFAAASEGIWDNGASCGREYLVRCLSAEEPVCIVGQTIQVKIVHVSEALVSPPSAGGTTMALSLTAFSALTNSSATQINIEFQQV